jgi:import receptor subunit TOM22
MPDETFADRLVALKDIVPPTYRKHLSNTLSTTSSWFQTTLNYGGKTLWVVSTSVLLLGVPWALAFAEEQQMAEMEREMKMQQSANEVSRNTSPTEETSVLTPNPQLLTQQQSQAKPAL